jgi:AraC-like DNA-binding protein
MQKLSLEQFGFNAMRLTPPKPMGRIHHHHEIELNFLFSGEVTYLYRGATRRLGAGRLAVFWGAEPHSLVAVAPGSDLVWITLPLAVVRSWGINPDFMRDLLRGEWIVAPEGSETRFPIAAWAHELSSAGKTTPRGIPHELQGCLWWLATHVTAHQGDEVPRDHDDGLRPVERMAKIMAERYQEQLDVATIAKAAGLHPNYAMALFKKRCGLTIHSYLAQLRVTHAQRRLLENDAKVTDVAFESGFATLSVFYDTFSRRVGLTPTNFRTQFLEQASE